MDNNRDQSSSGPGGGDYTAWVKSAPPEAVLKTTIAGLGRIAELPQHQRNEFFDMVRNNQTIAPLLDELKTPA